MSHRKSISKHMKKLLVKKPVDNFTTPTQLAGEIEEFNNEYEEFIQSQLNIYNLHCQSSNIDIQVQPNEKKYGK